MLCEQVLGKLHDFDTTGKTIEYVDIEWHEAFKKIHKKITDKGTEVGIRMDDSILARGLYQDDVCLLYTSYPYICRCDSWNPFGITIDDRVFCCLS